MKHRCEVDLMIRNIDKMILELVKNPDAEPKHIKKIVAWQIGWERCLK